MTVPHQRWMRQALRLAQRGYGATSPNPIVGAVLVKQGKVLGRGWHRRAGMPHAEIEALRDAAARRFNPRGATLYITLEPCSTHGRTPPCTQALIAAGIKHVVIGATDPNPAHRGKAYPILRRAGIEVTRGVLQTECERLNESFNHWIVHRQPFVTVKAAMTLDGKIATRTGQSHWITGPEARAYGMRLRWGTDAILVGINTVLADNPSLTARTVATQPTAGPHRLRRIVLDARAKIPLTAQVLTDADAPLTTIVVSQLAPTSRIQALRKKVNVLQAPLARRTQKTSAPQIHLPWLLKRLGAENVTSLLVEGGGEVNASFLLQKLAQRVAFFYAPKVIGGSTAKLAVAGAGVTNLAKALKINQVHFQKLGEDLLLTGVLAGR